MKRMNRLLLVAMAGILLTVCAGCSKLLDYVNEQEGGHQLSKYRIKTITGWGESDSIRARFTYNQWGDPVTILLDKVTTGSLHSYFYYDKKRRLTDFISSYGQPEYFERWFKCVYNAQGTLIGDTCWYNGTKNPLRYSNMIASSYHYDSYGRIIKVSSIVHPYNISFEDVYTYNSEGNRFWQNLPHPDYYDSKVNFLRTDPIWQLASRDYSLNNPFTADAYNEVRLPTKLHYEGDYGIFHFLLTEFPAQRIEITYEKK